MIVLQLTKTSPLVLYNIFPYFLCMHLKLKQLLKYIKSIDVEANEV